MFDKQLSKYLEFFRISHFDQLDAIKVKCALCRLNKSCCTVTFAHIKTGHTMVRSMCEPCADRIRSQYAKLDAKEDIDA